MPQTPRFIQGRPLLRFASLCGALLFLTLTVSPLSAQSNAVVTGRVTNANGQPEKAVLVRIQPGGISGSTDANGVYRLVIPGSRIRAGQSLHISASRRGLVMRSGQAGPAQCDSLTFDFQMGAAGTSGQAGERRQNFTLGTDVLQLCAHRRENGAVLRRADLQGSSDRDLLSVLAEVAAFRPAYGTSGLRPIKIGNRPAADVEPAIYVDGVRAPDASVLSRLRVSDVDSVEIRPGHLPAKPGYPAAPGGLILVTRAPGGVAPR